MKRVVLGIEYDGSAYAGWQKQAHADGIQERVEKAIARVADHPVELVCAGRTDAGVHALNQVAHFDTSAERAERGWVLGTNSHLPADINVNWVRFLPEEFHARFSAVSRSYRYVILNRWVRSGLFGKRAAWIRKPLDADRMHRAAQALLGEHDFSSFRAIECQAKSPVRTLEHIAARREDDRVILEVRANAFLHHMVRNIAGVLIEIGAGERDADWAGQVLAHRDRTRGGITAPAAGLYFLGPRYPEDFAVPAAQIWPA